MSSGNNNSGILATVGLNPVPSAGFIPTNSITNIQGQVQSIACYSAYNITFVPPYSQFSIANAALNSPANKSLQNIPAQNLYSGTYFTNKIVMAPIQATASLNGTKLSLLLEYPDASGSYTPFPNVLLEQSTTSAPAFTSQNFTSYQITQSFYFPGISSSGQIDPYLLTVNGDQTNALLGIYYSFYFVECTTSTTGSTSCKFIPASLQQIASSNSTTVLPIAVAFAAAQTYVSTEFASPNFFLFNPSVLNQSTIPETDFENFTTQILSNLSPALQNTTKYQQNSQRILGILYFDQFTPSKPQTIQCVFGQTVLVNNSAVIKTNSPCNPPLCVSCNPCS
jgi:hypothetical protein